MPDRQSTLPAYFSADVWLPLAGRSATRSTTRGQFPAQLYPATDDRYVVGHDPAHQGGDIWATDAVLEIMDQEEDDWSGIFVSLPGVDKAAHMWGGVNDPEGATPGYDPMTHMQYATATADAQVGRIMDALEDSGELDSTLVVLTADHGSVAAADGHLHGDFEPMNDYGFFNWYYGDPRERRLLQPAAGGPAAARIDTGNVGLSYSDSSLNVWLKDQSAATVDEAAAIMEDLPDVTAVWRRDGDHYDRVSPDPVGPDALGGEKAWFAAQGPGARRHPGGRLRAGPDRHAARRHDVLRPRRPRRHPADLAADPDRLRGRRRPHKDLRGEVQVGRHHADDPAGDGHRRRRTPWTATAYDLPRAKR